MGRLPPDPATLVKDLERLLSEKPAEAAGEALDFSKPG